MRTQISLTENESKGLISLSELTGKKQSELIREAADGLLTRASKARRQGALDKAAGIWRDREDLPDFSRLRAEWDRE